MRDATDVEFRDAVRGDLPEIVRMLEDDALGATRESGVDDPEYGRAFDAIEADDRNRLVVAVLNQGDVERTVGCMQLTTIPQMTFRGGQRMQIEGVRVYRDVRGHGIGEAMMKYAIEAARAAGCHLVQLTSNQQRADAQRFYERLGFQSTHVGFKLYLE